MFENYFELSPKIKEFVLNEKPKSILEISAGKKRYGALLKSILEDNVGGEDYVLDRIDLNNNTDLPSGLYNHIYEHSALEDIASFSFYDVVFIADLLENVTLEVACNLIEAFLSRTNNSIIVMTPLYPYDLSTEDEIQASIRRYHPVAFKRFDFSYFLYPTSEGQWQFYSFYPQKSFPTLEIDKLCISGNHDRNKKLKVAYILPHKNLTGGMKTLLEQMRQLTKRGHKVFAYLKSENDSSVLPEWSDLDPKRDIAGQVIVPPDKNFCEYIKDVDIIMVGWMTQLLEFLNTKIPVVLWEQGSEALYGDYGELLNSRNEKLEILRYIYRIPICILGVSNIVIEVLKRKYGRNAHLLPNGIDTDFYHPSETKKNGNIILLVGNPFLAFKGFSVALQALQKAFLHGADFKVKWVCQKKPDIGEFGFPIEYIVMPSQCELAKIYRDSDILLSTSLYESFPLPPFEAMASGIAVIATDNGGIRTYASEGINILLSEQGDVDSLAAAVIYLLKNPDARINLGKAGRKTTLDYSFEKIALRLEDCLYSIVNWYNKKE